MENSRINTGMGENHISVVLAVYNGEKFLPKLLDSVLSQKEVVIIELVIVDDKSNDSSVEIIEAYQQRHLNIKLIRNEINLGPIGSFKKGAESVSTAYIAFADQDDIWIDNKLSLSITLLKKIDVKNKPALVFTDLAMIDEWDVPLHHSFWKLYKIQPANNTFYTILFGNIVTGCTMVINRAMLDEFVKMPLEASMHDHWLALIAFSFGSYAYLDECTVLYRVHQNSVTDKSGVTLGQSAKNFVMASLNKGPKFLDEYIKQAVLFKTRYAARLDKSAVAQLDKFIQLESSSGFARKLISKSRFLR